MSWLFYTFLAVFGRATYSMGTKVLTNRLPVTAPIQSILLTGAAAIITLAVTPFIGGFDFAGLSGMWDVALIMIVTVTAGNMLYFRAQQDLDVGTTQIAFSSIVIWATFLSSLWLGSSFSAKQGVGIVLLLCAIMLIQYRKGHRKLNAAVVGIIASAAAFAAFQVTGARISQHTSLATYMLLAYAGPTILAAAVYWKRLKPELDVIRKAPRRYTVEGVLFAAVTSISYYVFSYFAYRNAPDAGVVVVLLTTQVIFSVILATLFMGERSHLARKAAATALAFIASVLIKS